MAPPAPSRRTPTDTAALMREVLLALLPAVSVYVWLFGWGVVVQIALASAGAVLAEAAACRLRARAVGATLADCSALLSGWLLALCLPPYAPWWLAFGGSVFAILIAKQVYGGLGANVFNPAMVGYAALLISFPAAMTQWPSTDPGLSAGLGLIFTGAHRGVDGLTAATALDNARTLLALGQTWPLLGGGPAFGAFAGRGWEWIALAYLGGGLWLLWRRIIAWQIPLSLLAALAAAALAMHLVDAARHAPPLFHLLATSSMLGAFFVATDPVTATSTPLGRLVFGAGIGLLAYLIRAFGGYPDGIAFAVLLMNLAAPAIDRMTTPRACGQRSD